MIVIVTVIVVVEVLLMVKVIVMNNLKVVVLVVEDLIVEGQLAGLHIVYDHFHLYLLRYMYTCIESGAPVPPVLLVGAVLSGSADPPTHTAHQNLN